MTNTLMTDTNNYGELQTRADEILTFLWDHLQQAVKASPTSCYGVAQRITDEVDRICQESQRIQRSGDIVGWAKNLATHRLEQCLHYYNLGSNRGRIELQSTLSAMIYRYIAPPQNKTSYQARLHLIEDFLQGFYAETLNAYRRECKLSQSYSPKSLLELAEYMAFTERYAKRRINLSGNRSQQLIILRAQTFSQQQPQETSVDMGILGENTVGNGEHDIANATLQQLRNSIVQKDESQNSWEASLRDTIVQELITYLEEKQQSDCVNYFLLRLQDLSASEIEKVLDLTPRQRDYLQQRFKYHLLRFALSHRWELVHQWLEADLERNLGLTPQEWDHFKKQLTPSQTKLLELKQEGSSDKDSARLLGLSVTQVEKQWLKLLELAWEIRNEGLNINS